MTSCLSLAMTASRGCSTTRATNAIALTDDWLISADTSVPALLDAFIHAQEPGTPMFQRQEVIGLVTPADLNKLPAHPCTSIRSWAG